MKKIFDRDSFLFGIIVGAIAPWILFGILYGLNILLGELFLKIPFLLCTSTLQLIAIVVNVMLLRQYMVKRKYDKTGRGILLLTFIYIIAYFVNDFLIK
jgi:hypothetical protein